MKLKKHRETPFVNYPRISIFIPIQFCKSRISSRKKCRIEPCVNIDRLSRLCIYHLLVSALESGRIVPARPRSGVHPVPSVYGGPPAVRMKLLSASRHDDDDDDEHASLCIGLLQSVSSLPILLLSSRSLRTNGKRERGKAALKVSCARPVRDYRH